MNSIADELVTLTAFLQSAIERLDKAYAPTRKYAAFSEARCPEQMTKVVQALGGAVSDVAEVLMAVDDALAEEFADTCSGKLSALRSRILPSAVLPGPRPTADAVVRAILDDPVVAQAARKVLREANA